MNNNNKEDQLVQVSAGRWIMLDGGNLNIRKSSQGIVFVMK
jgi:hypothetical protein